ncbi:MAG: hypothetical protein AUI10_10455 [Actinobacteria bacterium 13_2_20CM_2_72_6]|nr:MAG: hypothetical protein AUI10_10455 [Actinobacteria bacterium 13_2_20CM_2_72_6]
MTDWQPATEAEAALRDALRTGDQELYFRILAHVDLLLPVTAEAMTGRSTMGWGTWTSGGRTHILAFTSSPAMSACMADRGGSARRVPYSELAAGWPNDEWWLAINPGLPIEGYLPAWFVAQLARGDVRLPGRTLGARARVEAAAAAQARGAVPMSALAARGGLSRPVPPQSGAHQAPDTAPIRSESTGRARVPAHAAPEPENEPRRLTAIPPRPNVGSRAGGAARAPVSPTPPPPPASPPSAPPPPPGAGGALPRRPVDPAAPLPVRTPDQPPAAFFATGDPPARPAPPARPTVIEGAVVDAPAQDRWSALREPLPREPVPSVPPPERRSAPDPLSERRATMPAPESRPEFRPVSDRWPEPRSMPSEPRSMPEARPVADSRPDFGSAPKAWPGADPRGDEPTVPDPRRGRPTGPDPLNEPRLVPDPLSERRPAPDTLGERYAAAGSHSERRTTAPDARLAPPESRLAPPESRLAPDPLPTVPLPPAPLPSPPSPPPEQRVADLPRRQPGAARPQAAQPGSSTVPPRAEPLPTPPEPVATRSEPVPEPAPERPAEDPNFSPANQVEAELLAAAGDGQTDHFLSTLLLAKVLIPVPPAASRSAQPGDAAFLWRREQVEGQPYVVVFTSQQRMAEYLGPDTDIVEVKFVQLIRAWPDESWSFAVNPGTPVGATLPGAQIRALAAWAVEVGLTDQPSVEYEGASAPVVGTAPAPANRPVLMQKSIAPAQVAYYLERGYDRVSGFVQRTKEIEHLTTPEQLFQALGLGYPGSPFKASDDEVYLLRWIAYRPDLYRIPFGGRDEHSMRAMQGWVIERTPFRGNGFAPGESGEVIAEFKVDSVRLPHGAQMWRMHRDSGETLVALLDADGPRWRPVGPEGE